MSTRTDDLFTRLHAADRDRGHNTPAETRRAAIWCADQTLTHAGGDTDTLRDLLRAVGLTPDPHALRRSPTSPSKVAGGQHQGQT